MTDKFRKRIEEIVNEVLNTGSLTFDNFHDLLDVAEAACDELEKLNNN